MKKVTAKKILLRVVLWMIWLGIFFGILLVITQCDYFYVPQYPLGNFLFFLGALIGDFIVTHYIYVKIEKIIKKIMNR